MNEVSIIINGVRYDAVEQDTFIGCHGCDLLNVVYASNECICFALIGVADMRNVIFKKSTKSFER